MLQGKTTFLIEVLQKCFESVERLVKDTSLEVLKSNVSKLVILQIKILNVR